jgi:carboxymethylenebutenolidase
MAIHKSDINLLVNNKVVGAYLASPDEGGPGVLVLHAWWGLKPFFKAFCDRLAEQGFIALAPDLNDSQIAGTIDEAKALMEKRNSQFTGDIIIAAKDFLLGYPGLKGNKIGVMGFSLGGAWALYIASSAPEQVAAVVVFYGSADIDFSKIKARVLGHYSDKDEWEPIEDIRTMESKLKTAGVEVTFHIYPGLPHWFVEDDRPEFNPGAAELSWNRTIGFLQGALD